MVMGKKTQKVQIRLSGQNIYTDKKNRTIYYDFISKQGYIVDKKHENQALFFKNRFAVIFFAAILCAGTFLTWLQAAIVFAVALVLAEFKFRKSFLKELEVAKDIDFERRLSPIKYIVENKEKNKVIMLAILYIVFAVLVVLNAYMENYTSALMVLSIALALFGLYCSIIHLIAFSKMK